MKKYKVLLNGKNFFVNIENVLGRHGFLSNKFVEAMNQEEAENKAVQLIRDKDGLKEMIKNLKDDPPMIYAEEITELETFDGIDNPDQGLIWYKEESH